MHAQIAQRIHDKINEKHAQGGIVSKEISQEIKVDAALSSI